MCRLVEELRVHGCFDVVPACRVLLGLFVLAALVDPSAVEGGAESTDDAERDSAALNTQPEAEDRWRAPQSWEDDSEADNRVEERPYYFLQRLPYGSDAMVHPIRLIANGGYGITQFDNRDNRVDKIDYATGLDNVWYNLSNPLAAIERNGWGDFFEREILPVSVSSKDSHYWPNYTLHTIGGGMSYRLMEEWYRFHGFQSSRLMALSTITAYHLLNEVVENDDYRGLTTDPVADFYVFNPLGILLFSSDRVARFFGETLQMADWSYQPSLDPYRRTIENHGQNFAFKLGLVGKWSAFYHMGNQGELGLSYRRENGESFSFGVGGQAKDLLQVTEGIKRVTLVPTLGLFYDRNNSMLASLIFAERDDFAVRLNVYPGALPTPFLHSGFFAALDQDGHFKGGITFSSSWLPFGMAGATHPTTTR